MGRKKVAIIANSLLLLWFSLDMFGVKLGEKYLVEGAFKDDGLFMLISVITFILFVVTKKIGKYFHLIWLSMWLVVQFLSHEWYTIFGNGFMGDVDVKINCFKDCIKIVSVQGRYVPDAYHTILHILLVVALVTTLRVTAKTKDVEQ
ncbi:MAG: hypothetical protein Q4D51_02240 [Eubacteriales bacterium]|nr:hypothetical protein [Eubacteriales bacterium]